MSKAIKLYMPFVRKMCVAKVKGVYKLLTEAEKEKAEFAKLFAAMGNA